MIILSQDVCALSIPNLSLAWQLGASDKDSLFQLGEAMGTPKEKLLEAHKSLAEDCSSAVKAVIQSAGRKAAIGVAECVEQLAAWQFSPCVFYSACIVILMVAHRSSAEALNI